MNAAQAWTLLVDDVDPGPATDVRRYWSGEGDLSFEGQTWRGTRFGDVALIQLSAVEFKQGSPDRRVTLSVLLNEEALKQSLHGDIGPVGLTLGFLHSEDDGATWARTPEGTFYGRASNGRIDESEVYSVDSESFLGDIDRSEPVYWSREAHVARYGANAKGFEQDTSNITVPWPPFG